ncbi:MAG: RluA family pseudouridine synthase [Myxococcota bacterium]
MASTVEMVVAEEEAGRRLDVFLVHRVPGVGRAAARRLVAEGKVRVNGRRAKKGEPVRAGDRVWLEQVPAVASFPAEPDPALPLRVCHEDARLVVVDKGAGVPSHPLRPGERGTVANALVARYPEMAAVGYGPREPGLVHRLDTGTSGLLVAARDARAFDELREALRAGGFDKRYVALCAGRLGAPRLVDFPIASARRNRRRVMVCPDPAEAARLDARPAETEVLEARPVGRNTLVTVRARTARRHQVRAHLAALGHPLVGDALYGGPALPGLARHFLHASYLRFPHPDGGEVRVEAPLPADLQGILDNDETRHNSRS